MPRGSVGQLESQKLAINGFKIPDFDDRVETRASQAAALRVEDQVVDPPAMPGQMKVK